MNSRKSILRYGIILYICVFLTGGPSVISSFAKITMKEPIEGEVITIKKGDTLWHLAKKYMDNPTKWPEFKKYNKYTNPNLIYPGEKMQIPVKVAKEMVKEGTKEIAIRSSEVEDAIKALQNSNEKMSKTLQSQIEELEALKKAVNLLSEEINRVENLEKKVTSLDERLSQAESEIKSEHQKSTKQIDQLNENVKAIGEKVDQLAAGGQQQITKIDRNIETLTTQVTQNQESLSKLEKKIAEPEGKVERPLSQSQKAFVVLTALAGSVAWFVVSALSHSD